MNIGSKRAIREFVTFEPKKRDYLGINKKLLDGWSIVSIMYHKGSYLCALEKNENPDKQYTVEDLLGYLGTLSTTKKFFFENIES